MAYRILENVTPQLLKICASRLQPHVTTATKNVVTGTREAIALLFSVIVRLHPDHFIPEHMTYKSNRSEIRAEQPGWQKTKVLGLWGQN